MNILNFNLQHFNPPGQVLLGASNSGERSAVAGIAEVDNTHTESVGRVVLQDWALEEKMKYGKKFMGRELLLYSNGSKSKVDAVVEGAKMVDGDNVPVYKVRCHPTQPKFISMRRPVVEEAFRLNEQGEEPLRLDIFKTKRGKKRNRSKRTSRTGRTV